MVQREHEETPFVSLRSGASRTRKRRILGIVLLVVAASIAVAGTWAYTVLRSLTPTGGSILDPFRAMKDPRSQFPGKDRVIVLVAGKDYNHDSKGIAYTKGARADTIMLLSVDLAHPSISALGIPRDTLVHAPDGIEGKINGTFQRGGIDLLRNTISTEFGVMVDHYVVLKADAVREIVNAVGGVEVEAIDDMFYEDSWAGLKIDLTKGVHRLTGEQAVGYVRFRKTGTHRIGPNGEKIRVRKPSSLEEGDLRRADRQQQLVRAVSKEIMSAGNLAKAGAIIDVAFKQVETDLTRTQVVALGSIFRESGGGSLSGTSIPGKDSTIGGIYYWEPEVERAHLTINWMLLGDDSAGRALTRVSVLNGTETKGAAKRVADFLDTYGFQATSNGNTRQKQEHSEVVYRKAAYEAYAKQIAKDIGALDVHKDTGDPRADWLPEIVVRLGKDAKVPEPPPSDDRPGRSGR